MSSAVESALDNAAAVTTYVPNEDVAFETCFKCYKGNFNVDAQKLDDPRRVGFLLRKLKAVAHEKHANYILPKTRHLTSDETTNTLKDVSDTHPQGRFRK
uniref:DUF7083 domain-containing protein n=1 Tax=Parascaris univalens TaxID=6257 RepID=A0A915CIA0_PARUN